MDGNSASTETIGTATDNKGNIYNFFNAYGSFEYFGEKIQRGSILSKIDKNGQLVWLKQFTNSIMDDHTIGNYIEVDTVNSNVLLSGVFNEDLIIPGNKTLYPLESGSMFVLKYDLDGNFIWSIQEGGNIIEPTIDVDINGNIYVSGLFDESISIGNTNFSSFGRKDAFIAKYSSDGSFSWAKQTGGEETEYVLISDSDSEGNLYITGEFISSEIIIGDYSISMAEGDGNILVAKLSTNGDVIWAKSIAGSTEDNISLDGSCWPTAIVCDKDNNIFIKGWFGEENTFDNITITSEFDFNKFTVKLNTNGDVQWVNPIRESSYSFAYNRFSVDNNGSVYLGGEIRGESVSFGDDFDYQKSGERDAYICKYLSSGDLDWVKTVQSDNIWVTSVLALGDDEVIVSGDFSGEFILNDTKVSSTATHIFINYLGDEQLSINDVYSKTEEFEIFPNPTSGNTTIMLNDASINKIEIINQSGGVVKLINKINSHNKYDLSNISRGLYLVKVYTNDNNFTKKLIIN